MPQHHGYLSTIEDVAALGLLSALTFVTLSCVVRRRARPLRHPAVDESGASYTLGLTLVTPVYTLLIAVIVECTLMAVVKLGTMYAAYAAGRSAMVWLTAEPPRPDKVQLAAAQAMTPFSSSNHADKVPGANRPSQPAGEAYFAAYCRFANARQSAEYATQKHRYAALATFTSIERQTSAPGSPITVTVEYEAPLHLPGVGRIFGRRAPWPGAQFYTRRIGSTITLDLEPALADEGRLGLGYDADHSP